MVRSKVEEDEEVLKSRQQLVENKTPAELAAISGLSDIPVPTRIQTLMRTKKRNLKSTEEKEMSKKVRYRLLYKFLIHFLSYFILVVALRVFLT